MEIKYEGVAFDTPMLQRMLSIGYPIAREIIDNLLQNGDIYLVKKHKYIFKEQEKENEDIYCREKQRNV